MEDRNLHNNQSLSAAQTPQERLALATSLCRQRGQQLTERRRQVLELLLSRDSPMGAYEIMQALTQKVSRPISPPTVYRALDFLISQGFVSKIESRNAYVPRAHPKHDDGSLFLICDHCGTSVELQNPDLQNQIAEEANSLGFQPARQVIEVEGTCGDCKTPPASHQGET